MLSCTYKSSKSQEPGKLSETQKRKIFVDSFTIRSPKDTATTFRRFMDDNYPELKAKNKYDPLIYALEEEFVDTTNINTEKSWFRISVYPVFRKPYCLIIEKDGDNAFLTTKITNGEGGYYTGTLAVKMKYQIADTFYNSILKDLQNLDFLKMPIRDTTCGPGFDGETWTFELIEKSKYHILERWLPEACGDNKTRRLAQIGLRIRELSKLDNVLEALGEEKSGM